MTTREDNWEGYTLEQLRFRRMVAMAKAEIGRSQMEAMARQMTGGSLIKSPMVSKLAGALSYVDYAMLAYRLGRTVFRAFRKK